MTKALEDGLGDHHKVLLLTLDEIDDLLRIGCTVRIVDEVVGPEP